MSVASPLVQIGLLGEAVDGAPVAVLVSDENGKYVAVNRHACELFGYPREELLQLSIRDIVVTPDVEAHYRELVAAREQRGVYDAKRKDGTTFRFEYRAGQTTIAGMPYYIAIGFELA